MTPLHASRLGVLALLLVLIPAACADNPPPEEARRPLRLLFLGDADSDRARDFVSFLDERFGDVHATDRWDWDRAALGEVDVVVLDWPQQDGVL